MDFARGSNERGTRTTATTVGPFSILRIEECCCTDILIDDEEKELNRETQLAINDSLKL